MTGLGASGSRSMDREEDSDDLAVSAWVFATIVCLTLAIIVSIIICCYCVRKRTRRRQSCNKEIVTLPSLPDVVGRKQVVQPAIELHQTSLSPSHSMLRSPSGSICTVPSTSDTEMQRSPSTFSDGFDTVSIRPRARSTTWSDLAGNPVRRPHRSLSREDHFLRASLYSRVSSALTVGQIHFRLKYDFNSSDLTITVIECQGLDKRETGGLPNPYVKVQVSPNCESKHETRVQKKVQNPQFDETFVFNDVCFSSLSITTVQFDVLDCYEPDQHHLIGILDFSLTKADLFSDNDLWQDIVQHDDHQIRGGLGKVLFALRFLPTAGCSTVINVIVMKARSLTPMTAGGSTNPYAKVSFLVDGKRVTKRKTVTLYGTMNPTWNSSCQFSVAMERLTNVSIVVSIMHCGKLGRHRGVGQVELGPNCRADSLGHRHWSDMLASPRQLIAMWHPLTIYTKLPRR